MAYEFPPAQVDDVIANERLPKYFYSLIEDQNRFVDSFIPWAEDHTAEQENVMEGIIAESKETFEGLIKPITGRLLGFEDYDLDSKTRQVANTCKIVRESRQQFFKDAYPDAMIFFADEFDDVDDADKRLLEDEEAVSQIIDGSHGNINAIIAQLGHFYRPSIIADGNAVLRAIDSEAKFSPVPPPRVSEASYSFSAFNKLKDFANKKEVPKEALVAATAITKSMFKHR
jgi:hypothetical protein